MAPCRVVAAVEADSAALPPRQFVQFHVETTPSGMKVAVTGCVGGGGQNKMERGQIKQMDLKTFRILLISPRIQHPLFDRGLT